MDIVLLISVAVLLVFLIVGITCFSKRNSRKTKHEGEGIAAPRGPGVRRAAGVRQVRQRRPARAEAAQEQHRDDEGGSNDEAEDEANSELGDASKVGAKKRAKLEAKAERKAQREIEEREREERKKREQKQQEERDKQSARERAEEKRREEAEKAAREEKERREYEEYLKLKEAFSVEEEGYEENDEQQRNILQEFVDYIKQNKVVILEDLAQHFNMKTTDVIDRVQQMQADGILSGVIDDRGKFIYISQQELEAVAKFVRQRGRVSITELAEHSNTLINLSPYNKVEA